MRFSTIYRINLFLKTISYNPEGMIDEDILFDKLTNKIMRCLCIQDVHILINEYHYMIRKNKKINRLLNSKKAYQLDIDDFKYTLEIDFYPQSKGYENFIITTALSKKKNHPEFISPIDNGYYSIDRKGKKYYIYTDFQYYLKHKLNKIIIYHQGTILMKIKNTTKGLHFFSNKSSLGIINLENEVQVIDKDLDDEDNVIAILDFDITKPFKELASCLLEIYTEDTELILLIGLASVLLSQDRSLTLKAGIYIMLNR